MEGHSKTESRKLVATMMDKKVKKTLSFTVALAGAVVLLYFAFRNIEWRSFYENLKQCNFWFILSVIAIQWIITT